MPQYRFHRRDGTAEPKTRAVHCEDAQAARLEAIIFAGETLKSQPELVWCGHTLLFDVVDDGDTTIFTLAITPIERQSGAQQSSDVVARDEIAH